MYEIASNGILQDLIINIEETVTKTKEKSDRFNEEFRGRNFFPKTRFFIPKIDNSYTTKRDFWG